jgi:hypothetical protein
VESQKIVVKQQKARRFLELPLRREQLSISSWYLSANTTPSLDHNHPYFATISYELSPCATTMPANVSNGFSTVCRLVSAWGERRRKTLQRIHHGLSGIGVITIHALHAACFPSHSGDSVSIHDQGQALSMSVDGIDLDTAHRGNNIVVQPRQDHSL